MPPNDSRRFVRDRLPWIAAIVLIVALRDTALWTAPRFWGEEADLYYQAAYTGPLSEALFGCPQGYYNLGCRLGTLLALLLPVEHAPLATTGFALLVQIVPPLLVLRLARMSGWKRTTTVIAVAAVMLAPPLHETWLTSTGSAYHLVLAGAIVLLYHEVLALRITAVLVVLAAGLSSGYAIGLLPIAGWFAVRKPGRGRTVLLATLFLAVAMQAIVFQATGVAFGRGSGLTPEVALAAFAMKCYVLPIAGHGAAETAGVHLQWYMHVGTFWRWAPLLLLPIVLMWVAMQRCGSRSAVAAFVCGHVLAITAMVGGLGDKHGMVSGLALGRYFLPVNALHLLAAIELLRAGSRSWTRVLPFVLIAGALVQGTWQYFEHLPLYTEGPDWRAEVAAWRRDPAHPIATWPATQPPNWFVRLPPP